MKLSKDQFSEWENHILNLWFKQERLKAFQLEMELMKKDMVIQELKIKLFASKDFKLITDEVDEAKSKFVQLRTKIEKELGASLDGKSIDPITLEVKQITDNKNIEEKKK